jgi:PST family polysaccharide transporter
MQPAAPTESPLQQRVFRGVAWTLLQTIGSRALSMAIIVVLARVLGPSDFGIVTMAFIVTSAMISLVDLGVSDVLVRRFPQDQTDYDSAFWVVIVFALALAGITVMGAAPLAHALEQPKLPPLLWILAATLPLAAIELLQGARMRAEMKFKPLAMRTLIATAAGGTVGIAMAFGGAGYWSLLAKGLVESVVSVALMWRACSYRPGRQFSWQRWCELFGSAKHVLKGRGLDLVIQRFDSFLISARLGPSSLALYSASQRIYGAFMDTLFSTVNRVTLPAFGRMGEDHARIRQALLRVVGFTSFFTFPAFAAIAILSEPLVLTLLGSQWTAAAPVLGALCAGGVLFSVSHFNAPVLAATGRNALLFRYMLCDAVLVVVVLGIGSHWGATGVAIGFAARVVVLLPLNLHLLRRAIGLSPGAWVKTVLPALCATAVSSTLLAALHWVLPPWMSAPVRLLTLALLFPMLHLGVAMTLIPGRCLAVIEELSRLLPVLHRVSRIVRRFHDAMRRIDRRTA